MEAQSTEEETPSPLPEIPPPIEIPENTESPNPELPNPPIKNPSPVHQRAATIDFHELTSNDFSEQKETTRFSDVSNETSALRPVRLRVRDFKPEAPAGEPGPWVRGRPGAGSDRGFVERESRLESVKSVVSKFGGSVSWKAQRVGSPNKSQMNDQSSSTRLAMIELEKIRRESAQLKMKSETMEASKAEILKEFDHKNSLIQKLKLDLEHAETEESRVKQELHRLNQHLETLKLLSQENDKGSSVDLVNSQREEAINEVKSVKQEIKLLQEEYDILVKENDILGVKAEEAVSDSKKVEKIVEELTEELNEVKKSLEMSSADKMEAEEGKIAAALAKDQDFITWRKELRKAQEELERVQLQVNLVKDLEVKLESSRGLLEKVRAELAEYLERRETEGEEREEIIESKRKEIEGLKEKTEEIKKEVDALETEVLYVKTELEKEKTELGDLKQRQEMTLIEVNSVKTEIANTIKQTNIAIEKERETSEKILELPKLMKDAELESEKSKSIVKTAHEEAKKSKEEAEMVKKSLKTLEIKINAVVKEIEAYKMSENIALSAIKALEQSQLDDNISEKITISFEEYFSLSKRAHEAEELSQKRIETAFKLVENAKETESNNLNQLNEIYKQIEQKKKVLLEAENNAIKAKDGKLAMEEQLREQRTESEQRRKSDADIKDVNINNTEEVSIKEAVNFNKSSSSGNSFGRLSMTKSFSTEEGDSLVHPMVDPVYMSSPEGIEGKEKKKKKKFFPRVIMFMAKKKTQKQEAASS